jgi:hypothetical protein
MWAAKKLSYHKNRLGQNVMGWSSQKISPNQLG